MILSWPSFHDVFGFAGLFLEALGVFELVALGIMKLLDGNSRTLIEKKKKGRQSNLS